MSDWPLVNYQYDGSFAGFLSCVYDSFTYHEAPAAFYTPEEARISFYITRMVETDETRARQVYASWKRRISQEAQQLAANGFLTCMPEREMAIYRFISLGYQVGPGVIHWLTDERVEPLYKSVQFLKNEAHLLKGFLRFADYGDFLAGRIQPRNRVLPLLRPHFCARYNTEHFLIYDETHQEALFYRPYQWAIVPLEALELPPITRNEAGYQALWKRFYDTVAIEGRYNPKLRMNNVPKRYWNNMVELKDEAEHPTLSGSLRKKG
ncbi:MAG: TIGR03915 family putative DNA repair protein [Clostridiales bacterium]|nr:TIGR03915 family putative DNA repair protein [Clostridiales bacterium]